MRAAAGELAVRRVLADGVGASMRALAYVLTTSAKSVEERVRGEVGGWTGFGAAAAAATTATAAAAAGRAGAT